MIQTPISIDERKASQPKGLGGVSLTLLGKGNTIQLSGDTSMFKTIVLVASASLIVSGCASHSLKLSESSAQEFVKGELIFLQPSRLVLESKERTYVAAGFEVRRHQDLAELKKRYGTSEPKHWDRISSGLDRNHESFSAEPRPRASSGEELNCRLAWRNATNPRGMCIDSTGKEFSIGFM